MQSVARTYFQTQVSTTTQGDLLIMLFDGALKFLSQARERLLAKDYAQKGILISKALDILTELQATLNPDKGGKLAERLKLLYLYCSTRLLRANMKMDVGALDETVKILTGLREAFAEANSQVETRSVEASTSQSLGPRAVAAVASKPSQGAALGLGMAAYAKARPVRAVADSQAASSVKVPTPHPSDGPALDVAHAALRESAAAKPQAKPQAKPTVESRDVAAPTVVLPQAGDDDRPVTPVRRIMAAYSGRASR